MPRYLCPATLLAIARSAEPQRPLAARLQVSDHTVKRVRAAMAAAGLDRSAALEAVQRALYKPRQAIGPLHPPLDYQAIIEQRASGLSVRDCWLVYRKSHPDGYRYSRFAELVTKNCAVPAGYVPTRAPIAVPVNPYCERVHYHPLPDATPDSTANPHDGVLMLEGDGWKVCAKYGDLQAFRWTHDEGGRGGSSPPTPTPSVRLGSDRFRFMRATHGLHTIIIEGSASVTTYAMEFCLSQHIDIIAKLSSGWTVIASPRNHAGLRRSQHVADRLLLAKRVVAHKLVEHGTQPDAAIAAVSSLKSLDALRLVEAQHALAYWRSVSPVEMRGTSTWPTLWQTWNGVRTSALSTENQHATHPMNALLNFGFAVAAARIESAAMAKGLDLTCGSLHETTRALVHDLLELDRARVTRAVLDYARGRRWKRADIKVDIRGEVRLSPGIARELAAIAIPSRARTAEIVMRYCRWIAGLRYPQTT